MRCRTVRNTFETIRAPASQHLQILDTGPGKLPGMETVLVAACFEVFSLSVWGVLELVDALLYLPGRWNT
jgi:hypothetical protein